MKKLHNLLKKLGFTKLSEGWGDTWIKGDFEVQISHKDYRSPASVYIERKNQNGWQNLTLKDAAEKLQTLCA